MLRDCRSVPCGQYRRGKPDDALARLLPYFQCTPCNSNEDRNGLTGGTLRANFFKREKARLLRAAPSELSSLSSSSLEEQLQCELHLPWLSSALDAAEIRSVGDAAVWVQKLGMIKDVKKLGAELKVHFFSHACDLLH